MNMHCHGLESHWTGFRHVAKTLRMFQDPPYLLCPRMVNDNMRLTFLHRRRKPLPPGGGRTVGGHLGPTEDTVLHTRDRETSGPSGSQTPVGAPSVQELERH